MLRLLIQGASREGTPNMSTKLGTSRLTVVQARTKVWLPIVVPQTIVQLAPGFAPRLARVLLYLFLHATADRGLYTLSKTTIGLLKASSFGVTT